MIPGDTQIDVLCEGLARIAAALETQNRLRAHAIEIFALSQEECAKAPDGMVIYRYFRDWKDENRT